MADKKITKPPLVKRQTFGTGIADWWMLPRTRGLQEPRYRHEVGAADVFVSLYPTLRDNAGAWVYEPKILDARADRGMRLFGRTFYIEIDRGTEPPTTIEDKLDRYIQKSQGERFHVIFILMDGKESSNARGNKLIPLLQARRRGNQFLLASHARFIVEPLAELLYSPTDQLFSLENVS